MSQACWNFELERLDIVLLARSETYLQLLLCV